MDTIMSRNERTLSVHNEHELLLKLEKAGLNDQLAQLVIGSPDNVLAQRVVGLLQEKQNDEGGWTFTAIFKDGAGGKLANMPIHLRIGNWRIGNVDSDSEGNLKIGPSAFRPWTDHATVYMTLWPGTPNEVTLPKYKVTNAKQQLVVYEISRIKA